MSPNEVICNRCGKSFQMSLKDVKILENGEFQVTYFACKACKQPYQVLTTDQAARELIIKRRNAETRLKLGIKNHFAEKTLKKYMKEVDKIKNEQLKRSVKLKSEGERLLKEAGLLG